MIFFAVFQINSQRFTRLAFKGIQIVGMKARDAFAIHHDRLETPNTPFHKWKSVKLILSNGKEYNTLSSCC